MPKIEDKAVLDSFLADNPDLEELSAKLATFNVFRALRIEREELKHSNTLAWLLDPSESHGLGDVFLRRIVSNMLLRNDSLVAGVSAAQIELMDLSDVEVRREWRNIDVVVIVHSEPNLVLMIENKVDSGEGVGQLAKYRKVISQEFPSFVAIPVFLTPDGRVSAYEEAADFICYSYASLLDVVSIIATMRQSQMPESVWMFLNHYLDTLRRISMQEDSLIELCQRIYRKHKRALDLIWEHGPSDDFQRVAVELLGDGKKIEVLAAKPYEIRFIPASWSPVIPENGTAWRNLSRQVSVACLLYKAEERWIVLIAEVCGMDDPQLRLACVTALQNAGFKLSRKAFREDAQYSRFFSDNVSIKDMNDADEVRRAIQSLMERAAPVFEKALPVLESVFKK